MRTQPRDAASTHLRAHLLVPRSITVLQPELKGLERPQGPLPPYGQPEMSDLYPGKWLWIY